MVHITCALAFLSSLAPIATAYLLPPKGATTVGGQYGQYKSLGEALNDTSSNVYFMYPGNYTEAVYITRSNVSVYGQTLLDHTYLANTVTISRNMPATIAGSNDKSGTVRVAATAKNVALYNLNIENTYGKPVDQSQAIALSLQSDKFAGYGVRLSGYQDTLYANGPGGQFFSDSLIEGSVDFIFGMHASLWIQKSIIRSLEEGYLTASGRQDEDPYWYVIDRCLIDGPGATYLGRPWRNYARVVFQNSWLGSAVNASGWSIWTPSDGRYNHTYYAEYNNFGPGARGQRVDFAKKIDAPINIKTVLNSTEWIDKKFL